jgi:hypothetical protein
VCAAAADEPAVRQTDFVVTDVSGNVIDPSAASPARSDGVPVAGIPHPLGLPGTFWSANHKLAYVQLVGDEYQLVYDDEIVARSPNPIEQLGDITNELAYCEYVDTDAHGRVYIAHWRDTEYFFPEPICAHATVSNDTLVTYGSRVYVNGKAVAGSGLSNEHIAKAFFYKKTLAYISTTDTPFETRLILGGKVISRAAGEQGVLLDAAVQKGRLSYSIYRPDIGWAVMWGGDVVSKWHAFVSSIADATSDITYVAKTPKGTMLFRGNKAYGLGYDTVRFSEEGARKDMYYITSKIADVAPDQEHAVLQDVLWKNSTKLVQSLYAVNYFSQFYLIGGTRPLVVVETMDDRPQYVWYEGRIGLRGLHITAVAEAGNRIAFAVVHDDGERVIAYINKEQ